MRSLRLASVLAPSVLALSLLVSGSARADVAPPPDAGPPKADMASTMAQPDMSASTTTDDGGCSMARHARPGALALAFGASALTILLSRRRRAV